MLTLLEINKAVIDAIKAALVGTSYSSVPLIAEDVSEPIKRPSLKIEIEPSTVGKFNDCCRDRTIGFKTYYFAADRNKYKLDNTKMQDIIEMALLNGIFIGTVHIPIMSIESEVIDSVLVVAFDLYTVELLTDTALTGTGENMETLNYKEDI